jgi:hypothetical protein
MELVDGESLADLLAREGRLDPARTVHIVRQAADGLAAAHAAGVVHRDVKPANILVTPTGAVKITDFGIARSASSVAVTGTGQVIGTAHYFSPEQATGAQATPASDVYALGAVAYECLAGRRPFEAENPVQIAVMHIRDEPAPLPPDVPAGVRALVERAMAKDPAVRPPDGAALRDAADRLAPALPTSPARTAVLPVPGPSTTPVVVAPAPAAERRRWLLPALTAAAVLLILGAALATVLPDRTGSPASDGTPTATAPAAPTATTSAVTTPAGIEVVAAGLVGRPVQQVQADLIGRGLRVEILPVETADVPAGQVTAVDPVGTLAPGDLVRLSYAVPPVVVPAPVEQGGGGRGDDDSERAEKKAEEAQKKAEREREKQEEREVEEGDD